jgi:hypothetical protein
MIASTIQQGQLNLATLERAVIKDNTLMPGEWYGGQLHLQPPESGSSNAAKTYSRERQASNRGGPGATVSNDSLGGARCIDS